MEPGGRRRPDLYADIPVEEDDAEKEEDEEEKKVNYEKEMEGKRRDDEDMQDSLVVEEGKMVKFPLVPLPLIYFPYITCFKVLSAMKK